MTNSPLVILASARKQSDTRHFLNKVLANIDYRLIDLLDFHISPYDYSSNYPATDDFPKVIDELLQHQVIVFATPVYWYAMSGLMKTFIDRFTDLVTIKKESGRKLQGKLVFLLTVGADRELPGGFEIPFKLTSDYLNMTYQDCIYFSTKFPESEKNLPATIGSFTTKLKQYNR